MSPITSTTANNQLKATSKPVIATKETPLRPTWRRLARSVVARWGASAWALWSAL